jgi:Flp pilus assembly protein TadG
MLLRRQRRRGAVLVETAMIYPLLFMIILGIILLGTAVFRYQQVAHCSREGARWAAVHGTKYCEENAQPATTAADIFNNAIKPQAAGMGLSGLTYTVTWTQDQNQTSTVKIVDASGQATLVTRANTVSVTVNYSWNTGLFGAIPVRSTYVMQMSY